MTTAVKFGEDRICKRCGHITKERIRVVFPLGNVQNDAYADEYCEHCRPQNTLGALFNAAMPRGVTSE